MASIRTVGGAMGALALPEVIPPMVSIVQL